MVQSGEISQSDLARASRDRMRQLFRLRGVSMEEVGRQTGIEASKIRRWCTRGIGRPDSRTWEELTTLAEFFGLKRPLYIWTSGLAAETIERLCEERVWQQFVRTRNELKEAYIASQRCTDNLTVRWFVRSVREAAKEAGPPLAASHVLLAKTLGEKVRNELENFLEEEAKSLARDIMALIQQRKQS